MKRLLFLLALVLFPLTLTAQTIVDNPTRAEFQSAVPTGATACASPVGASDHLCADGRVTGYRLDVYNEAGTTLVAAGTLIGKGTVTVVSGAGTAAAVYSVPVVARAASATKYTAKLVAVGPSGEAASAASGPFRWPVPIPAPQPPVGVTLQ